MASQNGDKRETLKEFETRFGSLSDRMEGAVHPEVQQDGMPRAELQSRVDEREAANDPGERPGGEFLEGKTSQPEFENAVANYQDEGDQGRGSQMVKDEGAENNLPPPEDSQEVDRDTHEARMAQDDEQSRRGYSAEDMAEFREEAELAAYDRDHAQDQTQDYDQTR